MSQMTLKEASGSSRTILEYPIADGKVVLTLEGEPPSWVEPVLRSLSRLLVLPANWDSYGGHPVDPGCVLSAWQLLAAIMRKNSPCPAIVPAACGGVQLEWHKNGLDLEIEVGGPQKFHVTIEEVNTGQTRERQAADLQELSAWVARLSNEKG